MLEISTLANLETYKPVKKLTGLELMDGTQTHIFFVSLIIYSIGVALHVGKFLLSKKKLDIFI